MGTENETQWLKKTSEQFFFEVFNKLHKKCPVLIPDTVFVAGGAISHWYFSSKKNGGAILKKRSQKLHPIEVFKTLYR